MQRPTSSAGLAALLLLAALGGCGSGEGNQAQGAPPPVAVTAFTVAPRTVPNVIELPGRIEPVRMAEVRARTDGIVEARLFEEGTSVTAGQPLFRIEQRDYRAQVQQAEAALRRAQAALTNASAIVRRYRPLVRERAVSAQEFDSALASERTEAANVADARAALDRARLLLSYTIVRAPIAGRVNRAEVTEGALVSAASGTLMTRVDQSNPIYASFSQPNAAQLDLIRAQRAGTITSPALSAVPVRLILDNGTEYGPGGTLDFAAQVVDPATGSQTLRARFPNPERLLLPGQFVRGRIALGQITDAIVVPQRAVQIAGEKATVSIVARDGSVTPRPVVLGQQVGGDWVIRSGLRAGERIILDGWQKVQPGMKVQVREPGRRAPAQGGQPAAPANRGQPSQDQSRQGQAEQAQPSAG